ncbi:MAG: polyprenol monophosphomannose synthase [Rhodothermaceae bacterium]|uniref:polyprenol monophosphomannose synthase n=1 Tax=Rubrivirga sp. SAORIC476 TaxID=1961794 RepID=UPI000BA90ADC|nr:polyprenol monophosphomannose synthase [Rubrivirga sp. SAORIC476]MAQ93027.1 polyprenol monophosphomannose synthase [Rhodothermaceae bacterium]MBC13634.1 polyprenol monophosphomannose synthase [Rhodothermaceae bacterium]
MADIFLSPPAPGGAVVVVPTYNETANIEAIVRQVLGLPGDLAVLVVDDGSPDGTGDLVDALRQQHPDRVGLLRRAGKLGLGTAYLDGFRVALDLGFSRLCEMDADFSHNPNDLPRLIAACAPEAEGGRGADVAIGSRYVDGLRVLNWPLGRLVLSYGAGVYTRLITRLPIRDVTAGFKCFRREVLEAIPFDRVKSNGYSFQIEMNYRAWRRGFTLVEVPIIFTERSEGESKMSSGIVREAMGKVWELRARALVGRL